VNIVTLLWVLGVGLVLLLLAHRLPLAITRVFARTIGLPEAMIAAEEALAELAEAKRQLAAAESEEYKLEREHSHLAGKISTWRRDIAQPRRERLDLLYEFGTPQTVDAHIDFIAVRQPVVVRAGSGLRLPDPDVWRKPRLVRVWGRNGNLCLSMAQQRFGSKREFALAEIDPNQPAEMEAAE